MAGDPSELELVRALQAKQVSALGQIYDCYGDLLLSLALRILQNQQEAEDLVQEVLLLLWRKSTYDPKRGSLKSYLLLLVRSRAIDRLRSQKYGSKMLDRWQRREDWTGPSNLPLQAAAADEISQRVQAALSELPENQRQALEMSYYQGLSQSEISKRLNVPLGTVKSWFRLSFNKLRLLLQDLMH